MYNCMLHLPVDSTAEYTYAIRSLYWGRTNPILYTLCLAGEDPATFVPFFGASKCPHHGKERTWYAPG